jgi:hypothetical protein
MKHTPILSGFVSTSNPWNISAAIALISAFLYSPIGKWTFLKALPYKIHGQATAYCLQRRHVTGGIYISIPVS